VKADIQSPESSNRARINAMSAVRERVRRTIRRHALCPPGSRVLVGLSGGSDSVALTFLLRDLAPALGFEVAALAHVNHQLRDTAPRDEAFCRALAIRVRLPILVEAVHVRQLAEQERLSIEEAARRARYAALERAADEVGAARIAVGHTVDDQAETFVLKLVRGAGAAGLGGIYASRGRIVRPVLDVSRAELRAYLAGLGEAWVDDETNADVSNPRNRVRHDVLPHLEGALGLPARRAIARAAGLMGEDALWLDEVAAERARGLLVETADGVELDAERLRLEPPPLARRILHRVLRARAAGREIGLEHVQTALDVLTGLSGAAEVPGSRVELRGKKLVLVE
jgi:tRNA(Ile)-lysidine synthase